MMATNSKLPPNQFPVSTRQALLEKSQKLPSLNGRYSSSGWSNRCGTALTPAAVPGVYTADRPFLWNNIDVGCRMTVIELLNAASDRKQAKPDLWIHSPVSLDGPLKEVLDELGTVRHVISPNYEHLKFAPEWAMAYPNATIWGCPGLMDRDENSIYDDEIPASISPANPELWPGVKSLHISTDTVPILDRPFFNEVIFYHTTSKSLITTDFYWNYPAANGIPNSNLFEGGSPWELAAPVSTIPKGTQVWKWAMDRIYAPFYRKFMISSEEEYRKLCNTILDEWEIETIIPAHGDLIRGQPFFLADLLREFWRV